MRAYLPLLGCGLMMLVCVGPMLFGRRHNQTDTNLIPDSETEVQQLRQEVRSLRSRLDRESSPSDQDLR